MVLVIDRSQSMEEDRRLDLAKEAAKQSVRVLEAYDKAGVIAFSDDAQWIAGLAPVADKADLLKRIDTLTALRPDEHGSGRRAGRAGPGADRRQPAAYDPVDRRRSRAGRLSRARPTHGRQRHYAVDRLDQQGRRAGHAERNGRHRRRPSQPLRRSVRRAADPGAGNESGRQRRGLSRVPPVRAADAAGPGHRVGPAAVGLCQDESQARRRAAVVRRGRPSAAVLVALRIRA